MKFTVKFLSILFSALLIASPVSAAWSDNYTASRTYSGQFGDISSGDWYYDNVVSAYSLGIINGKSDNRFEPSKTVTIAETVKIAALCHQLLVDGKTNENAFDSSGSRWFDGYLSYCMKNGIVTEEYDDYNASATRAQIAVLFSRAITSSGIAIENLNNADFGDLPDVSREAWYAGAVYKMYNWGIITGSTSGNINPTSYVKRSEISTVIMRVIDPDERVTVGEEKQTSSSSSSLSASSNAEKPAVADKSGIIGNTLSLYPGDHTEKTFSGTTAIGGYFTISGGVPSMKDSYSIDLADDIILEKDNISFRLYKNEGFESLGIVRGWMNNAACGSSGEYIADPDEMQDAAAELLKIRIGGKMYEVSELWYANHGDYTTYAFYFSEDIDFSQAVSVEFVCGKITSDQLRENGNALLADFLDETENIQNVTLDGSVSTNQTVERSDEYIAALTDAKDGAYDIIFAYEGSRCAVIYGRGLYGRDADDYRLVFIFRDGSTQTVSTAKLDEIRINSDGDVLYYKVTAPDGKPIQYGVNFD